MRGDRLAKNMSSYPRGPDRGESSDEVRLGTQVTALRAEDGHLAEVDRRPRRRGNAGCHHPVHLHRRQAAQRMALPRGADQHRGLHLHRARPARQRQASCSLGRRPRSLTARNQAGPASSRPGDVRYGSTKRVAGAAVTERMAVALAYRYLGAARSNRQSSQPRRHKLSMRRTPCLFDLARGASAPQPFRAATCGTPRVLRGRPARRGVRSAASTRRREDRQWLRAAPRGRKAQRPSSDAGGSRLFTWEVGRGTGRREVTRFLSDTPRMMTCNQVVGGNVSRGSIPAASIASSRPRLRPVAAGGPDRDASGPPDALGSRRRRRRGHGTAVPTPSASRRRLY